MDFPDPRCTRSDLQRQENTHADIAHDNPYLKSKTNFSVKR